MKELANALEAIRQLSGDVGFRPMLTAMRLAARYIESYAVNGGARAILNQDEVATLKKAVCIIRRACGTVEKALEAAKAAEEAKKALDEEYQQARRRILLQLLPCPTSPAEYRNVLLWRIAGDVFFNPCISKAYFPDVAQVKRDLTRCNQSHLSSLDNVVCGWWLEVHLYLSDNLWPRDQPPVETNCRALVEQFTSNWSRRAEYMCSDLVTEFDRVLEKLLSQNGRGCSDGEIKSTEFLKAI